MVNKHKTEEDFKGTVGAKLLAEWKYRIFEKRRVEERSSYEGLTEDAWALGAEEGRDKLRKAAGRSKYLKIRGYPNEGTPHP